MENYSREVPSKTLVGVDLSPSGLNLIQYQNPICTLGALPLPGTNAEMPSTNVSSTNIFFTGNPLQLLKQCLNNGMINPERDVLLLGVNEDPFYPFDNRFELILKSLSYLTTLDSLKLWIRTRSPLVLLSMPVIKQLQNRLVITIALETLRNSISNYFTPKVPRTSERITTIKTLHHLGFWVDLQVTPIIPKSSRLSDIRKFATLVNHLGHSVSVFPFPILPFFNAPTLVPHQMNRQLNPKLSLKLRFDAEPIFRREIIRLSPGKLITAIPACFLEEDQQEAA